MLTHACVCYICKRVQTHACAPQYPHSTLLIAAAHCACSWRAATSSRDMTGRQSRTLIAHDKNMHTCCANLHKPSSSSSSTSSPALCQGGCPAQSAGQALPHNMHHQHASSQLCTSAALDLLGPKPQDRDVLTVVSCQQCSHKHLLAVHRRALRTSAHIRSL